MATKPNIVCFITDDTGPSMLGYGGGDVITPNIDRLAREGVVATRFYTSSPVCTPGRYSFLAGHHPQRCPLPRFQEGHEPYRLVWNTQLLPDHEKSLGHVLQSAGYRTGYCGKWHCGGDVPDSPDMHQIDPHGDPADHATARQLAENYDIMRQKVLRNGFDYVEGLLWGNPDDRAIPAMRVHNLDWVAHAGLQFIGDAGDQPFFLYLGTSTMHGPHHLGDGVDADPRLTEKGLTDEHLSIMGKDMPPRETLVQRVRAAGLDVNHRTVGALWTDDVVGAIWRKLETMGVADNTVLVFSTDHNHECWGKSTLYEGGVKTPFAMRYPGVIPAGRSTDALLQSIDLLPTLAEIAGADLSRFADMDLQGDSMLSVLRGDQPEISGREDLFVDWGYTRGVVTKRHKYFAFRPPQRLIDPMKSGASDVALSHIGAPGNNPSVALHLGCYPNYFDADQLYDLEQDPNEQHNLAYDPQQADLLASMRQKLREHLARNPTPFALDDPDPFLHSDAYRELCQRQTLQDPTQMDWYRDGAYT